MMPPQDHDPALLMPEPLERRALKAILIVLGCIAVAAILLYCLPPGSPP
jgi:hypothetical protein